MLARSLLALATVCLMCVGAFPHPVAAQADGDPVILGTYRVLHSEILGEDRVLQIKLPRGYDEAIIEYPVVYLFYSDLVELYYAQTIYELTVLTSDQMPPVILVGVANTQRYRDLLPWVVGEGRGGQAERFLRVVNEEIVPFIEAEYRTKGYRIMVGPQAAAEFGAYALVESPETFDAVISEDPCGIDGPERSLCRQLAEFARTPEAAGKYLSITAPGSPDRPALEFLREMESALEAGVTDGFRWRIDIQEPTGLFLPPVGIRAGLRDLFQAYPLPTDSRITGLPDLQDHYGRLSDLYGFTVDPPDLVLTLNGADLSRAGEHEVALDIFLELHRLYPASMNGVWQLAHVYRELGDTATAIGYYEECLRRDPNMTPAREWLERLKGRG
ncbi:alpha/beta hydrolase-fold protein [Gemmatimonadota bacterium]